MEQIRLARKQHYGASSEKTVAEDGFVQLSYLFNELECMAREGAPEPDIETVAIKAHARRARRSTQEKLPEDIASVIASKGLYTRPRLTRFIQTQHELKPYSFPFKNSSSASGNKGFE
ncbi:MAG: transposase domain-containing protein [Christensenellales bacterium]